MGGDKERLNQFLKALGQRLGRTDLSLEGGDAVSLVAGDGTLTVTVEAVPDRREVLLHTVIGRVPADRREAFLAELLRHNVRGAGLRGAVLGLSAHDDAVILCHRRTLDTLDQAGFENTFDTLIQVALAWSSRLAIPTPAPRDSLALDWRTKDWYLRN